MAILEKLTNEEAERETAGYIKLFKKKNTNKLMYLDKDGREKVIIDKDILDTELAAFVPTSEYTETIVNISSAQIIAGGSMEILPEPGVGKYYEFDKIIIESTSSVPYTFSAGTWYIYFYNSDDLCLVNRGILNSNGFTKINIFSQPFPDETNTGYLIHQIRDVNNSFGMYLDGSVTDGDGTLRVKIYHKTITFGA